MLLLTKEDVASLRERLVAVSQQGALYFDKANPIMVRDESNQGGRSWAIESDDIRNEAETLRTTIKALSVDIAGAARGSPLLAEADIQELRHNTRQMLANVHFHGYRHAGVYIHHDEGTVLGVDPPSHEEFPLNSAASAHETFNHAATRILDLIDLLSPTDTVQSSAPGTSSYQPNTAFIMMATDNSKPELEDIKNGIKEAFSVFGIQAITADEIEHDEAITDRILDKIETSEFLIADLTHERPNVYYEIGYAHARNKRVILFRKKDTKLHFDVAHRNCPEYENTTDLKRRLRTRLEAVTNKRGPAGTDIVK